MSETPSSAPLALDVGDFALRFRIVIRGDLFRPHKCVEGVEAVYIVAIKGDVVTWTNGRENHAGAPHESKCNRNELIPLRALEFSGTEQRADEPAVPSGQRLHDAPLSTQWLGQSNA